MTYWRFIKTNEYWRHQCRFIFWRVINISPSRMKEQRHVPPCWETFHRSLKACKQRQLLFKKRCYLSPAAMYLLLIWQYKFNTWPNTMEIPWNEGFKLYQHFSMKGGKSILQLFYFGVYFLILAHFIPSYVPLKKQILVLILLEIYLHPSLGRACCWKSSNLILREFNSLQISQLI